MRPTFIAFFCTGLLRAGSMPPEADQKLALDIYKQMVEIKSGFTTGATTPVVDAVAVRLKAAGFPASARGLRA